MTKTHNPYQSFTKLYMLTLALIAVGSAAITSFTLVAQAGNSPKWPAIALMVFLMQLILPFVCLVVLTPLALLVAYVAKRAHIALPQQKGAKTVASAVQGIMKWRFRSILIMAPTLLVVALAQVVAPNASVTVKALCSLPFAIAGAFVIAVVVVQNYVKGVRFFGTLWLKLYR